MQTQTISGYRISQQQRHLWTLLQNDEVQENSAYGTACVLRLVGVVEPAALQTAIESVVARHEVFRTTFYRPPGIKVPFQVIGDDAALDWRIVVLSDRPNAQHESDANEIFRAESERSFSLEEGPLLRATLVALSESDHLLQFCLPSLCADGKTLQNLVCEIAAVYAGRELADEDDLLHYADYAEWQHEQLEDGEGDEMKAAYDYWQKNGQEPLTDLRIPGEQQKSDTGPFDLSSITAHVAPEIVLKVDALCQDQGVTPAAFYLACWQTLLWRLTGVDDLRVAYVSDGRTDADLLDAMGPFARWLPVGGRFGGEVPTSEIAWRTHQIMETNGEWQDYFVGDDAVGLGADRPISFSHSKWHDNYSAGEISMTLQSHQRNMNRVKIQADCSQVGDGLMVTMQYDATCFDAADVERLAGQYVTLIASAASAPELPISQLDLLTEADRKRLLVDWNQTAVAYPEQKCIHHLFEDQAAAYPDRIAVVCDGQSLTYEHLNASANQLAHYLRERGVERGTYVGLCVDRSLEMVVGLLGVLKAGGAYVPLNPAYPAARLSHQLAEIETPVLLTQGEHIDALPSFDGELISLDADLPAFAGASQANPNVEVSPDDPLYVIYTSGSTGMPKGVVLQHRNLVNYSHFICQLLEGEGLQFAMVSTITADLGNTCLFPSLLSGGTLHVLPYDVATDGGRFASYISNQAIDVLKIVPSHLSALMASQSAGVNILPQKYLLLGGEAFTWTLYDQIAEQVRQSNSRVQVFNHYGPTETAVGSLTNLVDLTRAEASHINPYNAGMVPVGRPIANTRLLILDEHQALAPIGVPGELYIGGAGVAQGYLERSELTAENFIDAGGQGIGDKGLGSVRQGLPFTPNPQSPIPCPKHRFYRTGDMARYLPNGQVEFIGRGDNQVKIRGFRIELEEIESILGQHTDVRQAVVLAREDEGAADRKRLVGYVVLERNAAMTTNDLGAFLKEELPDYMVPSACVLVESLPLKPNRKVDRGALPAPDKADSSQKYVAPSTPAEETLADIWATVLGREKVGIHDNFFADLGGDSILSIQIIARANAAGLSLTPKQIFEYQTIAELASVAGTAEIVQAEQGVVTGTVPLTPIQHWFFEQDFADPHHWNQAVMLQVQQALDPALLEQVVQKLVVHHDALRMRFALVDSGWVQVNSGEEDVDHFTRVDLSNVAAAEVSATIESQAAEIQASLNLGDGPLIRFVLFDVGSNGPARFLITSHHLVIDGVSWRHLLEDLQLGYQQVTQGHEIHFAPKTTSFKEWGEKLTEYAQSTTLMGEANYWLAAERRNVQPLPPDFPDGDNAVTASRTISVSCSEEETQAILHDLPETYNTQINDVLLTALAQAAAQWAGSRTLLVDLEGHGREDVIETVDISRTVGWFTTHTPVLLDLGSGAGLDAELLAIKEQLRGIPNNGIGYGLLRYLCADEVIASQFQALPEPEIAFNYLGQLDQALPKESTFGIASESSGSAHSLWGHRSYPIYVSGSIANGRLQLACMYSGNLYRKETVERFANGIVAALQALIDASQSTDSVHFTPSDFGLADLNDQGLDAIAGMLEELGE